MINQHQISTKRYLQLDFLRGIAIVLMVAFHISFDLNNFHFIDIDIYNQHSKDWFYFRMVIVTLFILSVGISLALVNENGINVKKALKRFGTIFGAATLVTIASFITFPASWIYFGVLHSIAVMSILALIFVRFEWLALLFGVVIVAGFNLDYLHMHWLYDLTKDILHLPKHTEDLVPITPWFGVVLIGIFLGKKRLFLFPLKSNKVSESIGFLGKHSLVIYLVHQPLFFGLIALAAHFLK